MINYAHRGASEYAPENTLSSFYLGLLQGANGIETDVSITKDGELILFHDDTLDRVTDHKGKVCDYTLEELKNVKVFGNSVSGFYDRIVTLREFLEKFSCYKIHFAIELKDAGVEAGTLALLKEFGVMDRATITSFHFEYLANVKKLDPAARIGWLQVYAHEEERQKLMSIGGEEMAPKAVDLTEEDVAACRAVGLGVRAWGLSSQELMKKMCDLQVDGMTVNFPDRLTAYLSKENI